MGYLLVTAVLVVTFGRLGDQYGRAKLFNLGFLIFTVASVACALVPNTGSAGALELIALRIVQGVGGAMLTANSTAIITDAFPPDRRGFALGVNQVAGIGGSFVGLIVGGLLSEWHWRAVFWVSVPIGIWGTWMGYRTLRDKPRDTQDQGRHRLVGQPDLRRRPDRDPGRHHLRPAALRRAHHGLDVAQGAHRPDRRRGAAGRLRADRDCGSRTR